MEEFLVQFFMYLEEGQEFVLKYWDMQRVLSELVLYWRSSLREGIFIRNEVTSQEKVREQIRLVVLNLGCYIISLIFLLESAR